MIVFSFPHRYSTCVSDCGVLFYIEILIQDLFGGPAAKRDDGV